MELLGSEMELSEMGDSGEDVRLRLGRVGDGILFGGSSRGNAASFSNNVDVSGSEITMYHL